MNNGENNFNNQNFEQSNANQNNAVQSEQQVQQNIQSEQTVNNPVEPPKKDKSYCGLLVVFMITSLLLTGFIVYDKAIKKEEKDIQIQEPSKQCEPVIETSLHNYYKIDIINEVLNNKNIKIELKHWIEKFEAEYDEEGNPISAYMDETVGYFVKTDLYFNGKFLKEVGVYEISNSLGLNEAEALELLDNNKQYKEYLNSLKAFEIIKGDKDYLYNKILNGTEEMKLLILNENGKIILDKKFGDSFRLVNLDESTLNYQKFVDQCKKENDNLACNTALYYIEEDAIYYVEDSGDCDDENSTIPQYRLTLKEDKANTEKIADCKYEAEGACN